MEQTQVFQINELAQVTLLVCGIIIRQMVSVITGKNLNIREINHLMFFLSIPYPLLWQF